MSADEDALGEAVDRAVNDELRAQQRAWAEVVVYALLPADEDGVLACCRAGLPMTDVHAHAHQYVTQRATQVRPEVREMHRRTLAALHDLPLPVVPEGPPPPLPEQRGPGRG